MQHPNHPDHDLLLIAAHAAGDLDSAERAPAETLLDTCAPCAALHRDLVAIAAATRALPATATATAPRDFRLSDEQAAGLRRRSWLRTILAPFAGARSATRPMAAAFTSLGVAGILIATLLPGMLGAAGSITPERQSLGAADASAAPAAAPGATAASGPDLQPIAGGPTAGPDTEFGSKGGVASTAAPGVAVARPSTDTPGTGFDTNGRLTAINPPSLLFTGSLALLALGLLLFGLRFAGRRLR